MKIITIKRNRKIPDPAIGFYATGLSGLQKKEMNFLESILESIKQYFDCSLSKYPPHISCRYLGYRDEIGFEQIKRIIPMLKKIYEKFLPIECTLGNLFSSWEDNPDYKPKLLMVEIRSPKLRALHKEILQKTKNFPIFSGVEDKNFNPHFTFGALKKEFANRIPQQVTKFIDRARVKAFKIYLRKAYIHAEKGTRFQNIYSCRQRKNKKRHEK
jgi:2'-5' RNA ligase